MREVPGQFIKMYPVLAVSDTDNSHETGCRGPSAGLSPWQLPTSAGLHPSLMTSAVTGHGTSHELQPQSSSQLTLVRMEQFYSYPS